MMNYQMVPIGKLKPDPAQPRKHTDEEAIKEMAVSIKNEGIINPIEIDKNFVIITGERRWRGAKVAGLTEVPVKILPDMTPKERFIRQIQENIHHNTMAPLDTAEALEKIRGWILTSTVEVNGKKILPKEVNKGYGGYTHGFRGVMELNNLLGIPTATINRYLSLLGVGDELKKALKIPGFQMTKVDAIKQAPEKYRADLEKIVATQTGIPRDTIKYISRGLNRAEKYGEEDKAEKLLHEDFTGLESVAALQKINKIVPDELARVSEPADTLKMTAEKVMELMSFLDEHPLTSLDDFHRPLQIRKLTALGFYLQSYLQGKDMKGAKLKETKLLK